MKKKVVLIFISIFLAGLIYFGIKSCLLKEPELIESADAIVVLTGGKNRIAVAVDLLRQQKAKRLFISGVHKDVSWFDLAKSLEELPQELVDQITLGHVACNTKGNALESKDWIERNQFKKVILVTAKYHVARSMSEFKFVLPDVEIIPYPVTPTQFQKNWFRSANLIFMEYSKFLMIQVLHFFKIESVQVNLQKDCMK